MRTEKYTTHASRCPLLLGLLAQSPNLLVTFRCLAAPLLRPLANRPARALYNLTLSKWTVIGFARLERWMTSLTGVGVAMTKNGPLNFFTHLSCRPAYLRGLT